MQSFVCMAATALIIAAALPATMVVAQAEEAAPIEATLKDQTFTPA